MTPASRLWLTQNHSPYFEAPRPSFFQTNVLSKFSFTNCYGYDFCWFFLKFGVCYNAVEYRHKCLNRQHISVRKNPCFIVYTTASPEDPLSVTSGLRVSVQPAKPASPNRFLCEEFKKFYVFSAHKIFTTFCAPFYNRISYFKVLAMP